MTGMIAPTLLLMLSLNAQQTAPTPAASPSSRATPVNDCRAEYRQAHEVP